MSDATKRNAGASRLPQLPDHAALFVDFDGLLATLARDSSAYALGAPWLFGLLLGLRGRCGGALAIVTGRKLETVDRLLSPVLLAGAGLHGAEVRLQFNQASQIASSEPTPLSLDGALHALMAVAPFSGRTPIYVGDGPNAVAGVRFVAGFGGLALPLEPDGMGALRHWLRERRTRERERRVTPRTAVPAVVLNAQRAGIPVSRM